jgi:hypothetical protein
MLRLSAGVLALVLPCVAYAADGTAPAPPGPPAPQPKAGTPADTPETNELLRGAAPPPLNGTYFQYGVSFTGEFVAFPGPICPNAAVVPCIFGSGGGVAIRVGYRSAGPWYIGGAYELTRQDPDQLYRLAILQQLRAELRYYVTTGRLITPYVSGGAGVAVYGDASDHPIDTVAPSAFLGVGGEAQLSRTMVAGAALAYRLMYFTAFTDSSGTSRGSGIASVVGFDLTLEARDPQ